MTLEPTAYHHKLLNDEAGLIVSERLTLSPRFPVNIGEAENPNGLSRETEPLVPLAKALDYTAALVAAERERCAKVREALAQNISHERGSLPDWETGEVSLDELSQVEFEVLERAAAALREGGEHG